MGDCPRLEFDNIMHIYCLGYVFYNYGTFDFYLLPLSINDVIYDITARPGGTILYSCLQLLACHVAKAERRYELKESLESLLIP